MKNMLISSNFDARFEGIQPEIWNAIARIDGINGHWSGATNLAPQVLLRLRRSVLITSSGASTRIEGAKLSDAEVEKLMNRVAVQKFSQRDEQEVRGYYELLGYVFDGKQSFVLSESLIKHFHKELLRYVEKDEHHRGEYKKSENRVEMFDSDGNSLGVVFETVPAYLTPKAMERLVSWTIQALQEKKWHPLLVIGNFIVEFLRIHPFRDGNGRLSRVLTNALLLKSGYAFVPFISHEKCVEDNKEAYYIALRRAQSSLGGDREDISPWLKFFLGILTKQGEMALDLVSSSQIEDMLSTKQLLVWRAIYESEEITPLEIVARTGVARSTVNQAIVKLITLKKIEAIGLGRATRYRKR